MKPGTLILKKRGRMLRNRAGTWTLTFTVLERSRGSRTGTGYQQLRGKRDDLVEHAKKIGIEDLYLPGRPGSMPIEYVASYFAAQDVNIPKYAHLSDAELEAQWWDTKSFVSEACETEHCAIEEELDRRRAFQQETSL